MTFICYWNLEILNWILDFPVLGVSLEGTIKEIKEGFLALHCILAGSYTEALQSQE